MTLYNLVRMDTATTGTADIVVTTAVAGYKDCTDVPNGASVTYSVFNVHAGLPTDSEIGHGTWNSATKTISRSTVLASTNGNAKINLTGSSQVALTVAAEDMEFLKLDQTTPQSVINGSPIVEGIQFDITPTTTNAAEGLLRWNPTDGTLDVGMSGGDVTMQLGQEMYAKVRNAAGYQKILNGQPVYISGRTGVYPNVQLSRSDVEATSANLGIATQDIDSPGFGYITTFGYVRGIKTDYSGSGNWGTTWAAGDKLYISKTIAGQLTNVEPSAPHHSDIVGTVGVVSATQGSILVLNEKHYAFQELTDVNGTALTTSGQIPVWNQAAGYFDFDYNITDYAKTLIPPVTKTENYTLTTSDHYVNCNGTFALTLPTAVGCAGKMFVMKNSGTGIITILTTSAQTIDGYASGMLTLSQYESVTVISEGANWIIT